MKRPEGFDRPDPSASGPEPGARKGRTARAKSTNEPVGDLPKAPTAPRVTRTPAPEVQQSIAAQSEAHLRRVEARARRRAERAEARRFTRESRRRKVTWLSVGAIGVILLTVLAIAIFSPVLALRTIQVEGASVVKASAVRSALEDQIGTPLALLDTARIDKDLSRFTLIRSYVTEIVPPNTLVVRIEERQAIGVVRDGDIYDHVDPAGVILRKSATRESLPVIQIGDARVGGAAFEAAVKVLLAMPSSVSSKVQSISATTLDNVSLTLAGSKHTVIWGSSAESDEKAQVLAVLLTTKQCQALPVLNITAPSVVSCGRGQPTPTPTPTPTATPTPPPAAG